MESERGKANDEHGLARGWRAKGMIVTLVTLESVKVS